MVERKSHTESVLTKAYATFGVCGACSNLGIVCMHMLVIVIQKKVRTFPSSMLSNL